MPRGPEAGPSGGWPGARCGLCLSSPSRLIPPGRESGRLGGWPEARCGLSGGSGPRTVGGGVDSQLLTLIDLQSLDTRIAAFEAEAARLPKQIDAIHAALAEAKKTVETLRAKADTAKKDLRTKEKDFEVITAKRTKAEARLWDA